MFKYVVNSCIIFRKFRPTKTTWIFLSVNFLVVGSNCTTISCWKGFRSEQQHHSFIFFMGLCGILHTRLSWSFLLLLYSPSQQYLLSGCEVYYHCIQSCVDWDYHFAVLKLFVSQSTLQPHPDKIALLEHIQSPCEAETCNIPLMNKQRFEGPRMLPWEKHLILPWEKHLDRSSYL